jgi:hypothetical protein
MGQGGSLRCYVCIRSATGFTSSRNVREEMIHLLSSGRGIAEHLALLFTTSAASLWSIVSTGIQVSVLLIYKSNFYCASLIVTSNPVHCQSLIVYVCFRLNSELVPLKLIGCARLRLNAMSIVGFLVISDIVSAPSPSPRIFCLHTILHRPIS